MTARATFKVHVYFHGRALSIAGGTRVAVTLDTGDEVAGELAGVYQRGPDAVLRVVDDSGAEHSLLISEVEAIVVDGIRHRDVPPARVTT